jgi:hypothetical protein
LVRVIAPAPETVNEDDTIELPAGGAILPTHRYALALGQKSTFKEDATLLLCPTPDEYAALPTKVTVVPLTLKV